MNKSKRNGLIALAAIGAASAALGYFLSKKENREKVKSGIDNTGEFLKNKLDEFDYKYSIIPCDEVYSWDKDSNEVTVTIRKKSKSIEDEI